MDCCLRQFSEQDKARVILGESIIMKKSYLLALSLISAAALPLVSHASDGTITFAGQLNSTTCTVSSGTSGSFTVTLPTLATTELAASGAVGGSTAFSIAVSGCTTNTTATAYFESGPNVDTASGRLSNASGTATGVDMQLLTSTSSVITMGAANGSQGTTAATLSGNAATQTFYLQYYATSATPAAGTYIATFTYTLVYV